MSEEEIKKFYKELQDYYGDRLANFEHYPKQFAMQVRLYKFYKERGDISVES